MHAKVNGKANMKGIPTENFIMVLNPIHAIIRTIISIIIVYPPEPETYFFL